MIDNDGGASWNNNDQDNFAAAYRNNDNNPGNRNKNIGLRVVRPSTPYFSQNFGLGKSKASPILCMGRAKWSPDRSPWSAAFKP